MSASIAIIVSTYNRPDALRLVLESLINQTLQPNEIIIADDGSTHDTKALIDKYIEYNPLLIKHVWHEDKGFQLAAIRNLAMAQAQSEYIIQIDGDILLHPYFVHDHSKVMRRGFYVAGSRCMLNQELTSELISKKEYSIPTFKTKGVGNRLNALRIPWLMRLLSLPWASRRSTKTIKGCNMAFWKEDILKVNGYNEEFEGWGSEDVELEVRFQNSGLKRLNLKFGAIQFHLWHRENNKERVVQNEKLVEITRKEKLIACAKGINQIISK